MFEQAILNTQEFTRPILTVTRNYADVLNNGAAALFFVNELGVAITCKHVAEIITASNAIEQNFTNYKNEKKALHGDKNLKKKLKELQQKYKYENNTVIQIRNTFQNCFDKLSSFKIHTHPTLDLAIIEFIGFDKILYSSYAKFISNDTKNLTGKMLCRLGFPFPEFNNYKIDTETDNIVWTTTGISSTPFFPIEGMITRFIAQNSDIVGIEMSTPGLKGQSGGPLFDANGIIYGMQSETLHLHLGFDIKNLDVFTEKGKEKVSNYPFLHVGRCVHASEIIKFLKEHNIKFYQDLKNPS